MKVFLAITAYDHKVFDVCSKSVTTNIINLMQNGIEVMHPYYHNDLYIDRARNICAHIFKDLAKSEGATDLVFIDSDLEFDHDAIFKLLQHDKDIVAGAYPYKKEEAEYPITLKWDENNNCKERDSSLVMVERAPTGLMRIRREVFDILAEDLTPDERDILPYFATGQVFLDEGDINWYGEDTAFITRWTKKGGEVFVEPNINFNHLGIQKFGGNYHEYLMGRSIENANFDETYPGIPGWMTPTELETIRYLSSKVKSVVEVGCWKGRTTKELLENCEKVYAVDHWQATESDGCSITALLSDVYEEFKENVGHYDNLTILKGASTDIAQFFPEQTGLDKAEMVFIDAGHTKEECGADIDAWLPHCSKIIAGHDYVEEHQGVKEAVNERFGKENIHLIGSIWWVELKGE